VERWKDAQVAPVLEGLATVDPETLTVAFFAREDAKLKVPAGLAAAVEKAGGVVAAESQVKPRALPGWVVQRGAELGLQVDNSAAKALIAHVGDRQQRLLRELEKLAIEYGPGATIGVEEVDESSASSAERTVFALVDAVVAGDRKAATRYLMQLREQGERVPSLLYRLVRGLRDGLAVMEALEAGQPPARIKASVRIQPWKVDKLVANAAKRDVETYRQALVLMADLEVESRGGIGMVEGGLQEDTAAVRAVIAASG
jgi:DNA polymerase-3 subunit delta